MTTTPSGKDIYFKFGWESTFKTAATTINKPFGHEVNFGDLQESNNSRQIYDLASMEAKHNIPLNFSGTTSVNFVLGNAYWLRGLLDVQPTTTGTGPYTHTFISGADNVGKTSESMTIEGGFDLSTDHVRKLLGCVFKSASLEASANETINVSLDIDYADVSTSTSLGTAVYDTYADPMTFQHASIEMPDGTTLAQVNSFKLNIDRKKELKNYLSSRKAGAILLPNPEYTAEINLTFKDTSLMDLFYGASSGPADSISDTTLDIVISNGLSGTSLRKLHITFGGVHIRDYSMGGLKSGEELTQNVQVMMKNITLCEYIDNTSTAP